MPAGSAGASERCRDTHGGFETNIRQTNINCVAARRLAKRWHHRVVDLARGPDSMYVGSYYCASRSFEPEHVRVKCTYGTHVVRFTAGP